MYEELLQRIETGTAKVGVIGLGYVGLPLSHALHRGGLAVLGFDVDDNKIEMLAKGENYLAHLGPELTAELAASDRFEATADFARLSEPDVVVICVPTPLGPHQDPDLRFVHDAARAIGRTLRAGQLVVLESTTYPGTTRDELLPHMLAEAPSGLRLGEDYFVAYSPEREDPGRKDASTATIPKVVGGLDDRSRDLAIALYGRGIESIVPVSSAEVAEASKILENTFRAVNIALVNELKVLFSRMGIDIWEVIQAASTKPFGFMPFYPGPGLGGHCIPIDPFYLTWKARAMGHTTRFIELAGEINTAMPDYVVERTVLALNEHGKAVNGSRVLVLGLAYKPNVDDTRESPSFELIRQLQGLGAHVEYSDPHLPVAAPTRKHDLRMESVELSAETVAEYDAVLIATDHDAFDYSLVARHARLIVDTRNAMSPYRNEIAGLLVNA